MNKYQQCELEKKKLMAECKIFDVCPLVFNASIQKINNKIEA